MESPGTASSTAVAGHSALSASTGTTFAAAQGNPLADVDGDGTADPIAWNADHSVYVRRSGRTTFPMTPERWADVTPSSVVTNNLAAYPQ